MFLRELPPCITRASASLTRLRLDNNYSEEFAEEGAEAGSTSGLVLLTRLTALHLLEMQHCDSTVIPRDPTKFTPKANGGCDTALGARVEQHSVTVTATVAVAVKVMPP
jgi:hypothetical protein